MLFLPRKVAGSVREMCLRERREEQEVTGRAEQPRLRRPRAPRPGPPQLGAPGASPPVRGAPTEFGSSPTSAAACVRTRKDVREEEGVVSHAYGTPPTGASSGRAAPPRSRPTRLSAAAAPDARALDVSLGVACCLGPVSTPPASTPAPQGRRGQQHRTRRERGAGAATVRVPGNGKGTLL